VWQETSTFLRVGVGGPVAPTHERTFEAVPATGTEWRLTGDLGRRYAGVSGDHNPIHLYALTAKAFGFPRQIAHGMWSKARCLAALEGRLPDAVTVEVAFKKPVLLPGAVGFGSARSGNGYAFSLTSPKTGAPHLLGRSTTRG
jgi:acyl dehydratase